MRKRRKTIVWGLFILTVAVTLSLTHAKAEEEPVSHVEITLIDAYSQPLITQNRIKEDLELANYITEGKLAENRTITDIETFLDSSAHVKNCEVHQDLNGNLIIKVWPRIPVARVFFSNGTNAYIDDQGYRLPAYPGITARVPVFTGHISDTLFPTADAGIHTTALKSNSTSSGITRLAKYVCLSEEWASQITQVIVLPNGQFELIPRIGQHVIQFGKARKIEEKFENLKTFYWDGLPYVGWNLYQTIDLRYEGQVVGRKHATAP